MNTIKYPKASLVAQLVKNPPAMQETWVQSLGWEEPLEKGTATHSSILAWRIPWTVYPWGHEESDDWATFTSLHFPLILDFIGDTGAEENAKESACQFRKCKRHGFDPWVGKIPWFKEWKPTPVFLAGKFHRQRSRVGYSPWGQKKLDTAELLLLPIDFKGEGIPSLC